jgi:hypothetical protein
MRHKKMIAGFEGIKCTVDTREPLVHLLRNRSASQYLYFHASKASSDAARPLSAGLEGIKCPVDMREPDQHLLR